MLSLLEQYPNYKWNDILESVNVERDIEGSGMDDFATRRNISSGSDDEFASFQL